MSGLSPTQRTLRALREQGRVCAIVEHWNAFGGPVVDGKRVGHRIDLFGILDIISLDPQRGVVGIQSTGTGFSAHLKKLTEERHQECCDWLSTPGTRLELWGWRKIKVVRGGKAMRWTPRVLELKLEDFMAGDIKDCLEEEEE